MKQILYVSIFLYLIATTFVLGQGKSKSADSTVTSDVIIGTPMRIPYSRIYPLLDGLFQDVSAIQIAQLNALSANGTNASSLDAVIQQFQASLQFSETLGIQNATTAQQSAVQSSNMAFQAQLINQRSQLYNLQFSNQQQTLQAQSELNIKDLPEDQKNAATQRLQAAQNNLSIINEQIKTLNGLIVTQTTANTFATPTLTTTLPTLLPAPEVKPTNPSLAKTNETSSPTFPASKQMENQVNLLWERLAYLVNTLSQSDDEGDIYLIKFNTGISADKKKRKDHLLNTQYQVTCKDKTKEQPTVLDLFPRMSALNISDQKYRDSKIGLGGFLSFFSVGLNMAYNREHLRVTQSLSQAAYITGFGIQTNTFGWMFGANLGEKAPAPGSRATFALVSFPKNCDEAQISLVKTEWAKAPTINTTIATTKELDKFKPDSQPKICKKDCVDQISYSPVEFASQNDSSTVTIDIHLKDPIDREQIVSINGMVLKRARDKFGRATMGTEPALGILGSGLLQESDMKIGTWFPVSNKEIILTLNPKNFSDQFPRIFLNSANGSIDISAHIKNAIVSGRDFVCPSQSTVSCGFLLPAIARQIPTARRFFAARWLIGSDDKNNHLIFQVSDIVQATSSSDPNNQNKLKAKSPKNEPWSAGATVTAIQGSKGYILQCNPKGEYLDCLNPNSGFKYDDSATFIVTDSAYDNQSVKGTASMPKCNNVCEKDPIIWSLTQPKWSDTDNAWRFTIELINVEKDWSVILGEVNNPVNQPALTVCQGNNPCKTEIYIKPDKFLLTEDTLRLTVATTGNPNEYVPVGNYSELFYLKTELTPVIDSYNEDYTYFEGKNLVFNRVVFSKDRTKIYNFECSAGRVCEFDKSKYGDNEGFLYFVAGNRFIPFATYKNGLLPIPKRKKPEKPKNVTNLTQPPIIENKSIQNTSPGLLWKKSLD